MVNRESGWNSGELKKCRIDGQILGNKGKRDEKREIWFEIVLYQVTEGHKMRMILFFEKGIIS